MPASTAQHLGSYSAIEGQDESITGLKLALERSGYLPIVTGCLREEQLRRAAIWVSIGPSRGFSAAERKALREFVEGGGVLVALAGADCATGTNELLGEFGLRIPPVVRGAGEAGQEPSPNGTYRAAYGGRDAKTEVVFRAAWFVEWRAGRRRGHHAGLRRSGDRGRSACGAGGCVGDRRRSATAGREPGSRAHQRRGGGKLAFCAVAVGAVARVRGRGGGAMRGFWLGLALLSGSWLFGVGYYHPAQGMAWLAVVCGGAVLLGSVPMSWPGGWESKSRSQNLGRCCDFPAAQGSSGCSGIGSKVAALGLAVTAVYLPWPWGVAPAAIAIGLGLSWVGHERVRRVASGAAAAGLVLAAQGAAWGVYTAQAARHHDLPWPLPGFVAAVVRLLGLDVAVDGSTLAVGSLRGAQRFGATWELLVDPPSMAFVVGAAVLLGIVAARTSAAGSGWRVWGRAMGTLALVVAVWLPLCAGLLVALLMQRVVCADAAAPLNVMDLAWSPWLHLALVAVPAVLARRFVALPMGAEANCETASNPRRGSARGLAAAVAWVAAGAAVLAGAVAWEPLGTRKEGRVVFVERHCNWEPTTRDYDTTHFGEDASYSYRLIYDYCSRFFETARLAESEAIDDGRLRACDVLVIKTPTSRYAREEVEALVRFVERGGGLLLIGEHTDFERTSTHLNDIARRFGFKFAKDQLYQIGGNPYEQWYRPPAVPHPIVQHLPPTMLAVSCSIDPGASWGRAVICSTGLWSQPADYRAGNFMADAQYRPEARAGAFVQLWETHAGRGRVLAWTDSTIFSNFSCFEPGKAELMLSMLDWLNRTRMLGAVGGWLIGLVAALAGVAAIGMGVRRAAKRRSGTSERIGESSAASIVEDCGAIDRRFSDRWLVLVAAGFVGWATGAVAVTIAARHAMPPLEPVRPLPRVVLDRTVSRVSLSHGGFTEKGGRGYGLLEQWIGRLGYFAARQNEAELVHGQALVVICPTRSVSERYREKLVEYVREGGRLLVIDSPDSAGSTANSLLWPLGLSVSHAAARRGKPATGAAWPGLPEVAACRVSGGTALVHVEDVPVAARASFGQGVVVAIGFGSLWDDQGLGLSWMEDATAEVRARSALLFAMVRNLMEDTEVAAGKPDATVPAGTRGRP